MSILKELYVSENWQQYLNELESKEDFKDKHLIQNVRKVISDGIDKISLKSFPSTLLIILNLRDKCGQLYLNLAAITCHRAYF